MKRILIIIPNMGRGGAQQVFRHQINFLSNYFEVTGCVFNWDDSFTTDRSDQIVSLDVPAAKNYLLKLWSFCRRIMLLRKIKKQLSIDIAISHLEGADYVNILSSRTERVICWIHGSKLHDQNINGLIGFVRYGLLIPTVYRWAHQIVTVSKGIAAELSTQFPYLMGKITVIYNGFDLVYIQRLKLEPIPVEFTCLFDKFPVLITHCRLSRQKNLESLLIVFKELSSTVSTKLIILGDGELRDNLLLSCKNLGLPYWSCWSKSPVNDDAQVYFLGHQENPFKFLHHASVYVMTSDWEGFPLALCEAMACRLPVITADCFTGPREILFDDLIDEQPVKYAKQCEYGFIMPLLDTSSTSKNIWLTYLKKMLTSDYLEWINRDKIQNRISLFKDTTTNAKTIKLLN